MTTGQSTSQARGAGGTQPSQRTLVIIPTYNERENLPLILGRLQRRRPDVHVLVVDDGSPDGTGQLADELGSGRPRPGARAAPHRQGRSGRGVSGRLQLGAEPRLLGAGRDGRRRQPRARTAAPLTRRRRRRSRPRDRIPLRRRRDGAQLAVAALGAVQDRQHVFAAAARCRHSRHHRRLPRLPARSAADDRAGARSTRRATASRST